MNIRLSPTCLTSSQCAAGCPAILRGCCQTTRGVVPALCSQHTALPQETLLTPPSKHLLLRHRHCVSAVAVIPSIGMAAAGLDSIGAIVGFAVASGVGIASGNLVYSILSGPLQVRASGRVLTSSFNLVASEVGMALMAILDTPAGWQQHAVQPLCPIMCQQLDLSRLLQVLSPLFRVVSSAVVWLLYAGAAWHGGCSPRCQPVVYQPLMLLLQVVYGLIVGAGCAFICSWTRLWNNVFKRTAAVLVSGECSSQHLRQPVMHVLGRHCGGKLTTVRSSLANDPPVKHLAAAAL